MNNMYSFSVLTCTQMSSFTVLRKVTFFLEVARYNIACLKVTNFFTLLRFMECTASHYFLTWDELVCFFNLKKLGKLGNANSHIFREHNANKSFSSASILYCRRIGNGKKHLFQ